MNRVKVFKKYEKLRNVKSDFILPVRKGKRPAMLWLFILSKSFYRIFFRQILQGDVSTIFHWAVLYLGNFCHSKCPDIFLQKPNPVEI